MEISLGDIATIGVVMVNTIIAILITPIKNDIKELKKDMQDARAERIQTAIDITQLKTKLDVE